MFKNAKCVELNLRLKSFQWNQYNVKIIMYKYQEEEEEEVAVIPKTVGE